jgi:hypothetical protein
MMGTLRVTSNYLNPYEAWRDRLISNPHFDADIWRDIAQGKMDSSLDEYINALNKSEQSITDLKSYYEDYNIENSDNETRLAALYNEVYGSRNNLVTMEREVLNPDGTVLYKDGKPVVEKYTVSEYEYYKNVIKETNDFRHKQYLREQAEERKESINDFVKVLSDVAAFNLEFVGGITDVVDGLTGFVGGIVEGVDAAISGESFSDAFVEGLADDDYRLFDEFHDFIVDFESEYTHFRDLDGNNTNLGKYLGGISRTVGQMLPSILITLATAGVGGAMTAAGLAGGKIVSAVGSGISQGVYYGSMAVNNAKDIYEQSASQGLSITSEQILSNVAVKTALEIGVEKILGAVMGGTSLDNIVFGRATKVSSGANKTLVGAGVKRILKAAGQEGMEEVLQEMSGWLTDALFTTWNENFSEISDVNFQSLIDAFVIGSIVSFGSSTLRVLKSSSKSVTPDSAKTRFGRKIAAYEYGFNIRSFVESYDAFNKSASKKSSDAKYRRNVSAAATKMYASYRIIASMYGEMGEARFKKASEILDKVQSDVDSGKYDAEVIKKNVQEIYDSVFDKDTGLSSELKKLIDEELKKSGITKSSESVTRQESEDADTDAVDQEGLRKILDKDKTIKKAVSTEDGHDVALADDVVLIPKRLLENAGADVVVYSMAEHRIIEALEKGTRGIYKISLQEVHETFVELTGRKDATLQDAIYSLVFDEKAILYKAMLKIANKDMYKLLESLVYVLKEYDVKDVADSYYKNRVNQIVSRMRTSLIEYLIVQQNADYELDILTATDKKRIARERWCKDIYNRVVRGEQLSEADLHVLKNRIEYTNFERSTKDTMYNNLTSSDMSLRAGVMNALDLYYDNIFTNKYDGATYMPENTIANISFNTYLKNIGLTLKTFLSIESLTEEDAKIMSDEFGGVKPENVLTYRKHQFLQSTYGRYVFNVDNKGNYTVVEQKTNKRKGFSKYSKQYSAVVSGEDLYVDKKHQPRTMQTSGSKRNLLVRTLLNSDVPVETALMLSIDDVIKDPTLLSKELYEHISENYKIVTPETAFLYLRELIPTLQEGVSITVNRDGTYSFVNVKPMGDALTKKNIEINEDTQITDLVKASYLKGRLEDLKIKIVDDNSFVAEYRPYLLIDEKGNTVNEVQKGQKVKRIYDNTIYLNKKVVEEGGEYLKFVFLHELQHAIQFENKMNLGFDENWIKSVDVTVKKSIIADVKKHMPHLFNKNATEEQEEKIVSDFVYFSTGESMAYGLDAGAIVDYYPSIVNINKKNVTVTMPWGSKYSIAGSSAISSTTSDIKVAEDLYESSPEYSSLGTYVPKMSAKNIDNDTKRYVAKKDVKGTILEGWIVEGEKLQMDPKLRKFILSTEGKKIDYAIQKKIDDKTLTLSDLINYIRDTNIEDMHVGTFKLINRALYRNKILTTPSKLKEFMKRTEQYYAIGKMFSKNDVANEVFLNDTDAELGVSRIEMLQSLPDNNPYKQAYQGYFAEAISTKKYIPAHTTPKGKLIPAKMPEQNLFLDNKYLRTLWMSRFDGSINSALNLAEIARGVAKKKLNLNDTVSFEKSVTDDGELKLADTLADDSSTIEAMSEYLASLDVDVMKDELRYNLSLQAGKLIAEKLGYSKEAIEKITSYNKIINELSDEQLTKEYALLKFSELFGVDYETFSKSEKLDAALSKKIKTSWSIVNAMRSNIRSINNRLSPKQIDILLKDEDAKQYFVKKNGKLSLREDVYKVPNPRKKGLYVYRDVDELVDIRDAVKNILNKVKSDVYNSKDNFKQYKKKLDDAVKQNAQLSKDLHKKVGKVSKPQKIKTISTPSNEFTFDATTFDTSKPIPDILLKILNVEFDEQRQSQVKYFAKENDYYTVTNIRKFMDTHTQLFLELTQSDVDEIVDYYINAELLKLGISESQYRLYKAVEEWMGGFIIRWVEQGRFTLDSVLFERLNEKMRFSASLAAQTLANRKSTLSLLNPEIELTMSAANLNNLNPSRASVQEMFTAIALGDAKRVRQAKKMMFESMRENYKGPKRSFFDKLLQFQRIGMLSGPGTFIRNKFSNVSLSAMLNMSDFFGRVISKKWERKRGQYVMFGTKVSNDAKNFIENNLINNGLLDELREGLSKYDSRFGKDKTGAENLLYMITRSIRTEIFYNNQTGNKFLDTYYNIVYKALSDDKAITKQMVKYLGKMLTEDAARSSSPTTYFSNGIDATISNTIAEAYRLAAMDFMHKPNFISTMEGKLFEQVPRPIFFAYKQLFPFAAASYNWFAEALKYNPIGLLLSIRNYGKLETTIEQLEKKRENGEPVMSSKFAQYVATRDIGKGIVGSIGTLIGILLAVFGVVKLDEEDDKYKLSVPGTDAYVDITDVFGSQSIFTGMTLAGSAIDFFKDDDKSFMKFMDIFVNTLDSMVLDSTIADLYNTFRYSGSVGNTLLEIPYKSLEITIPNFLKTFASMTRKYDVKYSEGVLGKIEKLGTNIIPFLDREYAQVDVYTGEKQVPYKAQWIVNAINKMGPIDIQPYNVTDIEKEAILLGLSKGMLTGKYTLDNSDVDLTVFDVQELNKFYGKLNKEDLEELVNDKIYLKVKNERGKYDRRRYSEMTDKQKKAAFEQIMSKNSSYSKVYILTSKGYKYYASVSEYNELRKLGITKNVYKETYNKQGFIK